uniref:Uncharacterized protein n=1 Tax=Rhizophora mucronata TaxID=61149 RepID=A0A2P2R0E0_RHIMU
MKAQKILTTAVLFCNREQHKFTCLQ